MINRMLTKNRKIFLAILIFILIIFIRNLAFWSEEQTFIFGDTAIFALYLSAFSENFSSIFTISNNFLFWNQNYLSIGLPTLSIIDLGYLYPPNTLLVLIASILDNSMLLFPLLTLSAYLHLAFGGYFVYRILKEFWDLDDFSSLIGGFLWVFIGFNLEYAAATSVIFSASYLPLCFYLNLRYKKTAALKYFFLYYVFLAFSFLVGYPMPSVLIFATTVLFNLLVTIKKIEKRIILNTLFEHLKGFFLITLPIISPLYFTSMLNFSKSIRGSVISLEGFLSASTSFSNFLEALLPVNTPFNTFSSTNVVQIYISFVGIVLILQARNKLESFKDVRNLALLILGILCTIVALGGVTSIPSLIYFSAPAISFFRRLAVFSLIPGFAFCIIVPQYIKSAFEQKEMSKPLVSGIKIFVLVLLLSQAERILYDNVSLPPNYKALFQSFSIIAVIGAVSISAVMLSRINKNVAMSLLVLAIVIEAGTVVSGRVYLNSKVNPMELFAPDAVSKKINQLTVSGERVDMHDTHHNYSTDHLGIEQTAGYVALASEYGVKINEEFSLNGKNYATKRLRDILGVKYVVKKVDFENEGLELIEQIPQDPSNPNSYSFDYNSLSWQPDPVGSYSNIYENPTALPRLYLATNVIVTPEQSYYLLRFMEGLEDSKDVFILLKDVKNQKISGEGSVDVLEYKRNYIKAIVTSEGPTFLANSTGYYPGWKVVVNGKPQDLVQTNWFMMGTYLSAGENTVEFIYKPFGIIIGLLYIILSAVYWMIYFEFTGLSQKRNNSINFRFIIIELVALGTLLMVLLRVRK